MYDIFYGYLFIDYVNTKNIITYISKDKALELELATYPFDTFIFKILIIMWSADTAIVLYRSLNRTDRSNIILGVLSEAMLKMTIDDEDIKNQVESEIVRVLESTAYKDKAIDGVKLIVKETTKSSVLIHLESNGRNVKFIVEKAIDNGDLTRFIADIFGNENIKMHLSPEKKYRVSVNLRSTNNILESLSGMNYFQLQIIFKQICLSCLTSVEHRV